MKELVKSAISLAKENGHVTFMPTTGKSVVTEYLVDVEVFKIEPTEENVEAYLLNNKECFESTGWSCTLYINDDACYICKTYATDIIENAVGTAALLGTNFFSGNHAKYHKPYPVHNLTEVQDWLYRKIWIDDFKKYKEIEL